MKNRMTKNNVRTLNYAVILFLFVFLPMSKIVAANSQATVNVPGPLVITILGSNPVSINTGVTYTDAGAVVTDTSNGVIPVTIISNNVNTTIAGVYSVVYKAVDIAGSVATATRIVNVISSTPVPVGGGGRRKAQSADILPSGVGGDTESSAVIPNEPNGQAASLPLDFCFNKNLNLYKSDPDVKNLQIFLNNNGFIATMSGAENTYYGVETENAVTAFQQQSVIIPFAPFDTIAATGVFDYATRKKANDILGCATAPETSNVTLGEVSTTPKAPVSTTTTSTTTVSNVITNPANQSNTAVSGVTTTGNTLTTNNQPQGSTTTSNISQPNFFQKSVSFVIQLFQNIFGKIKSLFGF